MNSPVWSQLKQSELDPPEQVRHYELHGWHVLLDKSLKSPSGQVVEHYYVKLLKNIKGLFESQLVQSVSPPSLHVIQLGLHDLHLNY